MNNLLYRLALKTATRYNKGRQSFTAVNYFLEKLIHYSKTGYYPDFEHPKIWAEFICHKKFYSDQQQLADTADKLKSREFVKEKIGEKYLTEIYDVVSDESEIDRSKYRSYPIPFIAKPNHASERIYLNEEDNYDKFKHGITGFLSEFGNRNNELYYKRIQPRLMIEEYLDTAQEDMQELKFMTFYGRVELITVSENIHLMKKNQQYHFRIYDRQWNDAPFQVQHCSAGRMPKPDNLAHMIELAETLAQGRDFVRVDFMKAGNRLKFGELTSIPSGGRSFGLSLAGHKYFFDHFVAPAQPEER